jgi:hypothetical protein
LIGWLAAALAMLVTVVLIVGEITNAGQRSWWGSHSLTTDTVSGLLVLLITVLVVNQLLSLRQDRQQSHAVAAQAAIVMAQAAELAGDVSSVIDGSGSRQTAADADRTYMLMLLISAPVFIDDPVARSFLEQAQDFGGEMTRTLAQTHGSTDGTARPGDRLDDAMKQLQSAAAPLLQLLSPKVRDSIQRIGRSAEGQSSPK